MQSTASSFLRLPVTRWAPGVALFIATAAMLGLAACATSRATREKFLERVPPPQPLLNASSTFGGGALSVQAWLGPSVRLKKPGESHPREFGEHRRGGERADRFATPFEEPGADANQYSTQEIDEMYGRVNYQYILPPRLALTLTFANTTAKPPTVAITDVNSALGNFAARPDRLTLAPGQEESVNPMLSNFDNNYDALDLTLAVRLGDREEKQVLHLRRTAEAAAPAPAK